LGDNRGGGGRDLVGLSRQLEHQLVGAALARPLARTLGIAVAALEPLVVAHHVPALEP
jgi:hypothetical protein